MDFDGAATSIPFVEVWSTIVIWNGTPLLLMTPNKRLKISRVQFFEGKTLIDTRCDNQRFATL
jgi:hypothetical protein